jgi:hypothetical protein
LETATGGNPKQENYNAPYLETISYTPLPTNALETAIAPESIIYRKTPNEVK